MGQWRTTSCRSPFQLLFQPATEAARRRWPLPDLVLLIHPGLDGWPFPGKSDSLILPGTDFHSFTMPAKPGIPAAYWTKFIT